MGFDMIRFILLSIISTIIAMPAGHAVSAEDYSHASTQHLQIGGWYQTTVSIDVNPIESAPNEDSYFDLLGDDVNSDEGRPIATWHAKSNWNKVVLTIEAPPMTNENATNGPELEYELIFTHDNGASDSFEISSGTISQHELSSAPNTSLDMTGTINFRLPANTQIATDEYPDGQYTAEVKFTIEEAL